MAPRTDVLWRSNVLGSLERCAIRDDPGTESIEGTAVLSRHDAPASIAYVIDTAADWSVVAARIAITAGRGSRVILIQRTDGEWFVDETHRPDLAQCTSLDLGWSPATNTLPLRSTPLAIGESASAHAAWLRFPELDVVSSEQTYARLAADRVRYDSATFSAELLITDFDVVTNYGDGLWHAEQIHHGD